MKLFCCYTPAHEVLYREYFLPSVPGDFSVVPAEIGLEGPGDFQSAEYIEALGRKMGLIAASIRENPGEIIAWSDVDILFLDDGVAADLAGLIREAGCDILFQREGPGYTFVNPGFLVCKASPPLAQFFEKVIELMKQRPGMNDQHVIIELLEEKQAFKWDYLPWRYYARTHGWPPPKEMAIYHANATPGKDGVAKKIGQFREVRFVRRHGLPALVLTMIKYAPRRIRRLIAERVGWGRGR